MQWQVVKSKNSRQKVTRRNRPPCLSSEENYSLQAAPALKVLAQRLQARNFRPENQSICGERALRCILHIIKYI